MATGTIQSIISCSDINGLETENTQIIPESTGSKWYTAESGYTITNPMLYKIERNLYLVNFNVTGSFPKQTAKTVMTLKTTYFDGLTLGCYNAVRLAASSGNTAAQYPGMVNIATDATVVIRNCSESTDAAFANVCAIFYRRADLVT